MGTISSQDIVNIKVRVPYEENPKKRSYRRAKSKEDSMDCSWSLL
jgi:hypothetical protein